MSVRKISINYQEPDAAADNFVPTLRLHKHATVIMRRIMLAGICLCASLLAGCSRQERFGSLVPDMPSEAPDYFCTWNIQGYVTDYSGSDPTRKAMNEENIFGKGKYQNWVSFYPKIREDLYFVMDDSWDIPKDSNAVAGNAYLGSVELDKERFPSFTGSPAGRLKKLTERIERAGWKGVGGWVCAQKAEIYAGVSDEEYWIGRLKEAAEAGLDYWKVDWGREERNGQWRRMLSRLGREHAPGLWIEHAMKNEYVEFSDVFRTYDVENVIAQPVTIQRVCNLLPYKAEEGAEGIVNCEDEPYIAAGLGCAIGIMRHPFDGNLPCGRQDDVFPPVGHNYKRRMDEVVRGVRWHRIALPFAVDGDYETDTVRLENVWELHENETWNKNRRPGSLLRADAPARVSRRMPLPVVDDTTALRPFVLASRYPGGAVAVAAIGRGTGRGYVSKEVPVTVEVGSWNIPVGLFGRFGKVTLVFSSPLPEEARVLAQDLAGDIPVDITPEVEIEGCRMVVPGQVIRRVGLMAATEGDLSDPGLVLEVMR